MRGEHEYAGRKGTAGGVCTWRECGGRSVYLEEGRGGMFAGVGSKRCVGVR